MKSLVAPALIALALSGCGGHSNSGQPHGASPAGDANAGLNAAPIESLRGAMPGKDDFPKEWQTQTQSSPPALLPGLSGTGTGISSVEPAQCMDFAAGFISAPGSSVPGEFVSAITAQSPSGVVSVLATRKSKGWEAPELVRNSLRDCSHTTAELTLGSKTSSATFDSSPVDSSAIHTDAAGRTTTISTGADSTVITIVRAQVRGVLVAATAHTNPSSGDDQQALLVQLVGRTVDKLHAIHS